MMVLVAHAVVTAAAFTIIVYDTPQNICWRIGISHFQRNIITAVTVAAIVIKTQSVDVGMMIISLQLLPVLLSLLLLLL